MAAWQFPLILIPANALSNLERATIHSFIGEDGWDVSHLWETSLTPSQAKLAIEKYLGPANTDHRMSDYCFWGLERGDDLALSFDGKNITELFIRIDMRILNSEFVRCITSIAKDLNCEFLVMEKELVIEPSTEKIEWYAKRSRAALAASQYIDI